MTHDDSFEDDLHAALGAMAREPAPEDLVTRVARIPEREPARRSFGSRFGLAMPRLGPGFAAVLGVVVIGLAVIVLRPLVDQKLGGSGSSPDSSAVAVLPSPSNLIASIPPTSVPSTDVPASPPPSSAPTPSPSPSPAIAFKPASVTFVSPNDGWALGSENCGKGLCVAEIERTSDGGRTWTAAPAPSTKVSRPNGQDGGVSIVVSRLRFANTSDGWAFGPGLWATHDGGATWASLTVSGLPADATVVALETARGVVHAVFYDGAQHFRIATSPVGSDTWTVSPLRIAVGAGPVPAIQLVLSGDTGWILENDRTVTGGARLVGGSWQSWKPACADVTGPAYLAASSATDLIASCDVGLWATSEGNHLFVSTDGGSSFAKDASAVPISNAAGVATPDSSTIVIAGSDAQGPILLGSFDAGKTWSLVSRPAFAEGLVDLGFTTPSQGVVVTTSGAGTDRLFMTRDGGHTWSAVTF